MWLMIREYSVPFVLAVLVHAAVGAALWGGWLPETPQVRELVRPNIIQAELLVLEPPPQPVVQPRPQPPQPDPRVEQRRAEEERQRRVEEERQRRVAEERRAEQERQRRAEEERQRRVEEERQQRLAEERRRAEEERQRRADEERQRQLADLERARLAEVMAQEAENVNQTRDAQLVQSYQSRIYQQVVASWTRPLSARRGMEALLLVELVPTGEVVRVTVLRSSGDTAFDRSAEQAVRRVDRFEVPSDARVFEANFRRFQMLFKPEDLLR
jgi:colicin import membrane protein